MAGPFSLHSPDQFPDHSSPENFDPINQGHIEISESEISEQRNVNTPETTWNVDLGPTQSLPKVAIEVDDIDLHKIHSLMKKYFHRPLQPNGKSFVL